MSIWDYLENPDKNVASSDEETALGSILQQCGSANTALLRLYRFAVLADQEHENLLDEIDRVGKLHEGEVRALKGLPVDTAGSEPLRSAQLHAVRP